jgi:hypothetical protein
VFAEPWPGPVAVWRSSDGATFSRAIVVPAPAIVGETLDALPAGPSSRFDLANAVRVTLYGGTLASVGDAALFAGANLAAVRTASGAWEVLQFGVADLVGARTWRLSRFLRGQGGSEAVISAPLPAGAPFVLLDAQVVPLVRGLDALGRPVQLRIVAAAKSHGDVTALALSLTPGPTALTPLAPVHLEAVRSAAGVTFTWIRRTRIGGDAWDAVEVPLGEAREAYELDIVSGASVVRTLSPVAPSVLYAGAAELADFGAVQTALTVRVTQISATIGRGHVTQATLAV